MGSADRLGPFEIRDELGRGGSGVVYATRWRDRDVALKVALDDLDESTTKRFAAEARLLRSIDHECVVEALDAGVLPDGRPYLLMPLLEGEPLATRLKRGPLPLAEALALLDSLSDAVGAIHDAGLVHRDIKPENVFLTEQGPVLLDFGIAKGASSETTTTATGLVRGTVATMAPERFFGKPASVATDIYELAVTSYAALTGSLPWSDPHNPDARLAPRLPSSLGVALPAAVEDELLAALSTRVERRPKSARAFAEAIRRASEGDAESSTRVTKKERLTTAAPTTGDGVAAQTHSPAPQRPPVRWGLWASGGAVAVLVAAAAFGRGAPEPAHELRPGLAARAMAGAPRVDTTAADSVQANPSTTPATPPTASTPTASPPSKAPDNPCKVLRDVLCSDPYTREAGWKGSCRSATNDYRDSIHGSLDTRTRRLAACRAALPAAIAGHGHKMKQPATSTGSAEMRNCQELVAIWCDPELGQLGAQRCARARDRLTISDPADREAEDQLCAQSIASDRQGADVYRAMAQQAPAVSGKP